MPKTIERRVIRGGQLRAKQGDKPGIAGIASVYNQQYDTGWMIETIKPGAFNRVLGADPDVRCLFNHDPNNLLGRTKSGTLRLSDARDGLHFECDTDGESRVGADVQRMIDRGDLDGCSFSFTVGKQTWRDEKDNDGNWVYYRDIEEIDELFDVGPVTFPAYTGTSVGTRAALWPDGVPAEIRSHVPALRADSEPTKKVDGEELTRKCFLLVGDPDKTDTWALPWKFSTDDKTKSHLRDALSRFDQVEGFSEEALDKAWSKLLVLCDHYDIDVADKKRPAKKEGKSTRDAADGDAECTCPCDACGDGNCDDCDCAGCDSEECGNLGCMCANARSRALLRARAHMSASAE